MEEINNRELLISEEKKMGDGASSFGEKTHTPIPHESFHDFRDYDPDYFGVSAEEHFADCVWPKNPF